MDKLFTEYTAKYNAYYNTHGKEIPRPLRLFDIKLRLALGIQINFDPEIAQTKTPLVKECYVLLIKLVELWNTWEALIQYAKTKYTGIKNNFTLIEKVAPETTASVLRKGFAGLIQLREKETFAQDFEEYTKRAKEAFNETSNKHLAKIIDRLQQKTNAENDSLVNLIYMERNLFDHTGEAVKMGMKYSNRKKLLTLYQKTFQKYILTMINAIL